MKKLLTLELLPLQADVAVLSPRRTPGVANGPVQPLAALTKPQKSSTLNPKGGTLDPKPLQTQEVYGLG